MRTAEAVICVSEVVRRQLEQAYRTLPPLAVVANGVDIERFRRVNPVRLAHLRASIGGTSRQIVLFAGRSNSEKGFPELLMATSLVAQREPGVRFIFALSDAEPHKLSAWRQMLPPQDCAVLYGNVARDEIPLCFRAADLIVMPSRSEPFGLVALEAMAAGKPLIVSDVEPLNQFVTDGVNGRVVPLAEGDRSVIDVRELVEAILHLVRLPSWASANAWGHAGSRSCARAIRKTPWWIGRPPSIGGSSRIRVGGSAGGRSAAGELSWEKVRSILF